MRKLCPNLDRDDGLDTVLEVPIPEEMFVPSSKSRSNKIGCTNMLSWMRPQHNGDHPSSPTSVLEQGTELQLMLGVIGAPLVPLPVRAQPPITTGHIKKDPIEASMAKYILQQYIAAAGGKAALNSISSMYAMGKVRMTASEFSLLVTNGCLSIQFR